jgi:hypothetical protein
MAVLPLFWKSQLHNLYWLALITSSWSRLSILESPFKQEMVLENARQVFSVQ